MEISQKGNMCCSIAQQHWKFRTISTILSIHIEQKTASIGIIASAVHNFDLNEALSISACAMKGFHNSATREFPSQTASCNWGHFRAADEVQSRLLHKYWLLWSGKMQPTRCFSPSNRWISKQDDEPNLESWIEELGRVDDDIYSLIAKSGLVRSDVAECFGWSRIGHEEVAVDEAFLERSV